MGWSHSLNSVQVMLLDELRMCIAYAPSNLERVRAKLAWFIAPIINKIPHFRARYKRKQAEKIYELAKRAANRNFSIKVLDSGWATQRCLTDEYYRTLTSELVEIDKMVGSTLTGGIPSSLHWSRRYEYPYAIMNSVPSRHASEEFKILDCGAGIGPIQFYLAMKGYEVYSLDLDLSALEQVARFKLKKRLKTLYPAYGNVLDLPFPNNYFDRVLSISVLEHIVSYLERDTGVVLKGFVNELLRVLKPEGLVILTFDVNMDSQKSDHRLYYYEYELLCEILGISSTPPPQDRLYSSDTEEGRIMGKGLGTYCVTLTYN